MAGYTYQGEDKPRTKTADFLGKEDRRFGLIRCTGDYVAAGYDMPIVPQVGWLALGGRQVGGRLLHATHLLDLNGDDHAHLFMASTSVPTVRTAKILFRQLLDVIGSAFRGHIDHSTTHLDIAHGIVRIRDRHCHSRIAFHIPDLDEALHAVDQHMLAGWASPPRRKFSD